MTEEDCFYLWLQFWVLHGQEVIADSAVTCGRDGELSLLHSSC